MLGRGQSAGFPGSQQSGNNIQGTGHTGIDGADRTGRQTHTQRESEREEQPRETSREEHRRWRVDSSRPRTGSNKITHPAAPLPSCSRLTSEIPARPQSHLRSAFAFASALAFEFTCSGLTQHRRLAIHHKPPLPYLSTATASLPSSRLLVLLLPRQSAAFVSVDPSCSPSLVSPNLTHLI